VDERTQGALLLAVGGIAVRLGVTDAALAYVKPGMQPLLAVAGVFLVIIGGLTVIRAFRGQPDPVDLHGHTSDEVLGHHAGHGPGVAWLLTLPLLALLLIAPPPLGAFAADRQSDRPPPARETAFGPLPAAENGAVPLKVTEFVYRALYDESRSLEGQRVRLSGFVTNSQEDGVAFQLTRFVLACCAADGQAVNVAVRTDQPAPAPDTWLEIEGTWAPREDHEPGELSLEPPLLELESMRPIEAPAQPYE